MRNKSDNKLNKFRDILITESCEHPFKIPISARHCSMSTGIIPKHGQSSWMSPV